jgi:ech hydrogenase subunit D
MIEQQQYEEIAITDLEGKVKNQFEANARLIQICCTKTPAGLELSYSFDKDYQFTNYKIKFENNSLEIPSVSHIYPNAFLYENELHDLFGLDIKNISIDYKGKFYTTAIKNPFNTGKETTKEKEL